MEDFRLEEYLSRGTQRIVNEILKASVDNPRQSIFMVQYAGAAWAAEKVRRKAEEKGEHIPPFLIASIARECNLHCKGCYARANESCSGTCSGSEQNGHAGQLSREQWGGIFSQARELGIGFILLAGGEPFTRKDILEEAGRYRQILFPVFTNGTMLDASYLKLFADCRNLIPVLSIEGDQETTDERRGRGVYQKLMKAMEDLKGRGIMFGASVTVTKENMKEVTSDGFLDGLLQRGCRAVIFVEYVPADGSTYHLAPGEEDRIYMENRLRELREQKDGMLYISFPGDEKSSGGCLAAGRGFFHINAAGGAEPCPFSPYSDTSLLNTTLRDALKSPLFVRLKEKGILNREHTGGCVLFGQENLVKMLL